PPGGVSPVGPPISLGFVTRLFRWSRLPLIGITALSLAGVGLLAGASSTEPIAPLSAAAAGLALGLVIAALGAWIVVRVRFGRLIAAAEQIAQGNLEVQVDPAGFGLHGRLASAINAISTGMAATHTDAVVDRLTG